VWFSIDKYSWVVEGIIAKSVAYKARYKGYVLQHSAWVEAAFSTVLIN